MRFRAVYTEGRKVFLSMNWSVSRRGFLGTAALAGLPPLARPASKPAPVKLGVCTYSFTNKMKLPEVIHAVQALGIHPINIKPEFHLPYTSTSAEIAEARKMIEEAGLVLAGTGMERRRPYRLARVRMVTASQSLGSRGRARQAAKLRTARAIRR